MIAQSSFRGARKKFEATRQIPAILASRGPLDPCIGTRRNGARNRCRKSLNLSLLPTPTISTGTYLLATERYDTIVRSIPRRIKKPYSAWQHLTCCAPVRQRSRARAGPRCMRTANEQWTRPRLSPSGTTYPRQPDEPDSPVTAASYLGRSTSRVMLGRPSPSINQSTRASLSSLPAPCFC